ncbi:MAG: carboxylesterase family protein, partial [Pseudomonadales bacterium]
MNAAAPGLRISCPAGDITGQETSCGRQFLGIPFAQPPVGPGRLAPPPPLPPGPHNAPPARPAPPQHAG